MLKHILAAAAALITTTAFAHSDHSPATAGSHGGALTVAEMAMAGPTVTIGELEISGAFARATLPNAPVGGGYLTITNKGAVDDRLVSVSTAVAGKSEIHEMKMEGDVMKMNALPDGLVVPAGQTVNLEPGGLHLMFMDLTAPLVEGQGFAVTLTFEKAGSVDVQIEVGSPAAKEPAMDHSKHGSLSLTQPEHRG